MDHLTLRTGRSIPNSNINYAYLLQVILYLLATRLIAELQTLVCANQSL